MNKYFIKKIISGGQTGVDRAALDVAIELDIPHGGWCPKGRKSEQGIIPAQYRLTETSSDAYEERTERNVQESDGTLIITQGKPIGGTQYTIDMIEKHQKPFIVFDLSSPKPIEEIIQWIISIDNPVHILNVAGPRASQVENVYHLARTMLHEVLTHPLLLQKQRLFRP